MATPPTPAAKPAAAPTPLAATPATNVTVTSVQSSLDASLVVGPGALAVASQPAWPTVWPPTPAPAPKLNSDSYIPWKEWQQVLATRSYATDPPPCPVVVSRYPGL